MRQYSPQAALLATDMAQSVIRRGQALRVYTPFGHASGTQRETAFAGQVRESALYLLGNGYRAYLPALGRFVAPDVISPFEQGGLNAYAYCGSDPVNRQDSNGANWGVLAGKLWFSPISNTLALSYKGLGKAKVLRFATDEAADATQMYKALGTYLSASQGAFGVMGRNAEAVKASAKVFEPIPSYSPLRDSSLFERAIDQYHAAIPHNVPIRPIRLDELPALPRSLDVKNPRIRRTILSYLYYQEMADPRVVQARGEIVPWRGAGS